MPADRSPSVLDHMSAMPELKLTVALELPMLLLVAFVVGDDAILLFY